MGQDTLEETIEQLEEIKEDYDRNIRSDPEIVPGDELLYELGSATSQIPGPVIEDEDDLFPDIPGSGGRYGEDIYRCARQKAQETGDFLTESDMVEVQLDIYRTLSEEKGKVSGTFDALNDYFRQKGAPTGD
ncbi:MAG: hypothetical protein ABEK01_01175 [Candidatus Nanohaloarchaea archaeon]